jgi:hypothetical protein
VVDVGPYVLGALSAEERHGFGSHLPDCPECRGAVDELAALPGWLDVVPPELVESFADPVRDLDRPIDLDRPLDLDRHLDRGGDSGRDADAGPPPALLADLVRVAKGEAARTRRRRAWTAAVTVAAAVVLTVLVAAGALRLPWLPATSAPTVGAAAIELAPVVDSPVSATVRLEPAPWGTRIHVTCEYATAASGSAVAPGYGPDADVAGPEGRWYALVVRDGEGRTEEVATWAAVIGAPMRLPASTMMPRDQIVEVELRGSDGAALLRADT